MGLIAKLFGFLGTGAARETLEVFRPNAEASDARDHARFVAALEQLAREKTGAGAFNQIVDGLNRLPRPAMAFGTIGLFVFAMTAPEAFAVRITALALVPDPLWWLLGAIVSFYFGARELQKVRDGEIGRTMSALEAWRAGVASAVPADPDPVPPVSAAGFMAAPAKSAPPAPAPIETRGPRPAPPRDAGLIDYAVLDRNAALEEALADG